jgi:hypothetical protein
MRVIRRLFVFRRTARRHTFLVMFGLLSLGTMTAWIYFLGLATYRAIEWTLG